MKPAKLMVLGVAGVAALSAVWLTSGLREKPTIIQQLAPTAAPLNLTEVLVAAVDLPVGSSVTTEQLRWQTWPSAAVSEFMIDKKTSPDALTEIVGAIARGPSLTGEPIRRDKMIKGVNGGFMSAVLPTGMRAIAINIASSGAKSAGGFILPNDRVDIIRTARDDQATKLKQTDTFVSETILQNIRVLAIGQNIQERNGEKVVVGETATLELEPRQSEAIALAQRTGELSLALRSLSDGNKPPEPTRSDESGELTVIRFGVTSTTNTK
ncbi:MAG: Flp pilus assembly protein CpaB [Beijerinckiaceae bacterium]